MLPVKSGERVLVIRSEGSAWRSWSDWYCRRHGTCWTEGQERSAGSYRCLRTARFWIRPAWTQRTTRTCRSNWPCWVYRCVLDLQVQSPRASRLFSFFPSLKVVGPYTSGDSDVTESAVTIRSPFCGHNMA